MGDRRGDPIVSMRIDRFLWFARFARSRAMAQAMAEAGTMRLDGRRVDRAHVAVRVGSVLAFVQRGVVRVIRVDALPVRRGPATEAAALYVELQDDG